MNFTANPTVIIPDVSFYQDDDDTPRKIDFVKMKAAGAAGVICRGGQNSWIDEDFRDYWRDAKSAGLPRGSYWFYDSRTPPTVQASLWKQALNGDMPELGLWIDLEESYNGPYKGEKNWKQFVLAVAAEFPSVAIRGIYSANWWWSLQTVTDPTFWAGYPLWVAQYNTTAENVMLPAPWRNKRARLWQFTDKGDGLKYGVESYNIDLNYFDGDEAAFRSFFNLGGGSTTPPPPTNGGTMTTKTIIMGTTSETAKLCSSPKGAEIGSIPANTDIEGDATSGAAVYNDQWIHVTKPKIGWVNKSSVPNWRWVTITVSDPPPVTPPPVPDPSDIVGVRFSGEVVFDMADGTQSVWHVTDMPFLKGPSV